jgi:uncharacterized membrane protein YgaE (UPF0421/DUF939 family)
MPSAIGADHQGRAIAYNGYMLKDLFKTPLGLKYRLIIAVKMVIAFVVGILVAEMFRLEYAYTAGVIAVIGLDLTRRRALQAAIIWLIDSLLAIGISSLLFFLLGYEFWVLIIFVAVIVPLSFVLRLKDGIVIALVLISQLYVEQDLSFAFNALYILLIGIAVAFLLNLYIPRSDKAITESIATIDQTIDRLIQGIAKGEPVDFTHVKQLIKGAKEKLFVDLENHYYVQTNQREDYIKMRRGQLIVLERIAPILEAVAPIPEKAIITDFLKRFAGRIGGTNYADDLWKELHRLLDYFKNAPLPTSRHEFEHRAELFHVLLQLDEFLDLKLKYHVIYNQEPASPNSVQ